MAVNLDATLTRARTRMKLRMTDACLVERQDGTVYDPDTATEIPNWVTVYTGVCEFVQRGEQATVREAAGRDVSTLPGILRLPHDATGVADGHRVTCTASDHRPELVGQKLLVSGEDFAANRTAIRVGLTAVTT